MGVHIDATWDLASTVEQLCAAAMGLRRGFFSNYFTLIYFVTFKENEF